MTPERMTPEQLIANVFDVDPDQVDETTSNTNLPAWDSLGHMNLILELEATFALAVTPAEALAMTDVATIKRLLRERGIRW